MSAPHSDDARAETHRCATGERCRDRERLEDDQGNKTWAGARLDRERGLCVACTRDLDTCLPLLVEDYVELSTLLGEHGTAGGEIVASSRDLPIPLRLAVKTLQEQIVTEADTWVEPVCERMGIDWLSTTEQALTKPQARLARAVPILSKSVSVLLALPPQEVSAWDDEGMPLLDATGDHQETVELDGVDAALRLLRLHNLTRLVAGRGRLRHKLPAPCPHCHRITLVRDNGESDVHCLACKLRWPEKDYERLCLMVVTEQRQKIAACERCDKDGKLPDRQMCDHKQPELDGEAA